MDQLSHAEKMKWQAWTWQQKYGVEATQLEQQDRTRMEAQDVSHRVVIDYEQRWKKFSTWVAQ
eukprot:5742522-Heterocapsa_arctica.AAC.1